MSWLDLPDGRRMPYFDPVKIIEIAVSSPSLTKDWKRTVKTDGPTLSHPLTSDGAAKYDKHRRNMLTQNPERPLELLLFSMFADGYRQKTCRGQGAVGAELILENLAPAVRIAISNYVHLNPMLTAGLV